MQGELFYIDKDDDTSLREWNWPDGTDLLRVGESGLMNKEGFQADSTSKMSAYWPFILSQGSDGFLQEVVYGGAGTGPTWNVSNTNTRFETTQILAGSAIAIVPAAQSLNTTNIFYQQTDRTITVYRRYDVKSIYQVDDTYPYKKPLPANAAIAAFSTPSTTKPASDVLNVYSLFQDADGKIQMVWHDDPDSIDNWKGPKTFSAFDGADVGTPIACVTMFTFLSHPMETFRIPRCFFVVGGSIRQVKLVGDDWDIVGLVGEEDE
ncbi:hypothetical protein K504DRAFT_87010 [Pleomassaria siparia CBS 279.74]|uniref:Fucose-specific lectin n=1 Tax=Pleomassaria siparia CBS 279.74 TaxID=1314801 RepID=A0A6G1K0M4_9PLEO|nr:hypothetical protein K504DRAFT_87010 [Pleomassaria siparia CBS 279.74]